MEFQVTVPVFMLVTVSISADNEETAVADAKLQVQENLDNDAIILVADEVTCRVCDALHGSIKGDSEPLNQTIDVAEV